MRKIDQICSLNTPDGRKNITIQEYSNEWHNFANKLKAKLGKDVVFSGYDPTVSFCLAENGVILSGTDVQIPVWFAKRILGE